MSNHQVSRREFINRSNTLIAGTAFTALSAQNILGANDRIRLGIIGCGERGRTAHIQDLIRFHEDQNITITAVCDIWKQQREKAADMVKEGMGKTPKKIEDYLDVISRSDVDAVVIATPEHQHTDMLGAAAKAKKDAYCEKPLAMNMRELRVPLDQL